MQGGLVTSINYVSLFIFHLELWALIAKKCCLLTHKLHFLASNPHHNIRLVVYIFVCHR